MKNEINIAEATMKAFPLPVVLVTCIGKDRKPNIITITYVTGVNEEPPMIAVAIRPEKHSNKLIKEMKEFVVNAPIKKLLPKIDYCGSFSGRDVDKFQKTGFTPEKPSRVSAPLIKECPINIECKLVQTISFPSHDLFIGKVAAMHVDRGVLKKEMPDFSKLDFLFTTFLDYREIGGKIGTAFKENSKSEIEKRD